MRAAEDHGVDLGALQRLAVGAHHLDDALLEREAALDHRGQVGSLYLRHGQRALLRGECPQVGAAAHGGGRRQDTDLAGLAQRGSDLRLGIDHRHDADPGLRRDPPGGVLSRRRRRVAGDHQQLRATLEQVAAHLLDVIAQLLGGSRPVGKAAVVTEVDVVLLRQRDEAFVEDGEPSHTRVEHRDREVRRDLGRHQNPDTRRRSIAAHAPSIRRSFSARPAPANAAATSSASDSSIPEQTRRSGTSPPGARWPAQSSSRFAVRLATTVEAVGGAASRTSTRSSASSTPFASALARAVSSDGSSRSQPVTGPQPSLAAAIASTPEPVPQSASGPDASPAFSSSIRSVRERRVVGWPPVPKARPGSTTTSIRPSWGSHQDGRTPTLPATSIGRWKSAQRSAQSSGTEVVVTSTRPPPAAAWSSPSSGTSPGGP